MLGSGVSSGGAGTLVEGSMDSADGSDLERAARDQDVLATHPRFALRHRLGSGTFGTVFEAFDKELGATVAIKTLVGVSPSALYRFKQEFRSVANVHHHNLVQLHELFSHEGTWFFSMERLRGLSFEAYVRGEPSMAVSVGSEAATRDAEASDGSWSRDSRDYSASGESRRFTLDAERLRQGLVQLVEAIRAIHGHGKLHRDIKDSNVIVEGNGRVVLLDFGLIADKSSGGDGEMVGTPLYMAPEQCIGERVGPACDWYALGVLLYRCLTGVFPFVGPARSVMSRKLTEEPKHPRDVVAGLPGDLADLAADLLSLDPSARPTGEDIVSRLTGNDGVPRPRVAGDSGVFVGRGPEMSELLSRFQAFTEGHGPVRVHIRGLTGLGKTRLAHQFLSQVPEHSLVLAGRCYEQETVPFKALDSVVDALVKHLRTLDSVRLESLRPVDLPTLLRVFPVVGRVWQDDGPSVASIAQPEPAAIRRRAFSAMRKLLRALAEDRDLVIFVDDLQWGDLDSARGLEELLRQPNPPKVFLMSTHRTDAEANSACLRRLLREPEIDEGLVGYHVVDLAPLQRQEVEKLVTARLGDRVVAPEVLDEARGNPLIVDQLMAFQDDAAEITSLGALTRARVRSLGPAARGLLEAVAVAGAPVRAKVAVRVAAGAIEGGRADQALAGVGQLRSLRLVRGGAANEGLLPYHDQIRQAVVEDLEAHRRKKLHLHLARELEREHAVDPERLGDHFEAGGELVRAREYLVQAGDSAMGSLAFAKAARLYRRVLGFERASGKSVGRIRRHLAEALESLGDGVGAARVYLELAEEVDGEQNLMHLQNAARCFLRYGNLEEGLQVAKRLLKALDVPLYLDPKAAAVSLAATRIKLRGRALDVPPESDPVFNMQCESLRAIGPPLGSFHHSIVGADLTARALHFAIEGGRPSLVASTLIAEAAFAAAVSQDEVRSSELLAQAARLAEPLGEALLNMNIAAGRGVVSVFLGRYDDAATQLLAAMDYGARHCPWQHYMYIFSQRFAIWALWASGRYAELVALSSVWTGEHRRRGDRVGYVMLGMASQANVAIVEDQPSQARDSVDAVESMWGDASFGQLEWCRAFSTIETSLYRGQGQAALAHLDREWPKLRPHGNHRVAYYGTQRLYSEACALLRGRAVTAKGRRRLERIAKRLSRGPLREQQAKAEVVRAGMQAHAGQAQQAAAGLGRARGLFEQAQMSGHVDAIDLALRRLGLDAPDTHEALKRRGVVNPERFGAYLIPVG